MVQRQITGELRREKRAKIMEAITSFVATIKKSEMYLFHTVKPYSLGVSEYKNSKSL